MASRKSVSYEKVRVSDIEYPELSELRERLQSPGAFSDFSSSNLLPGPTIGSKGFEQVWPTGYNLLIEYVNKLLDKIS